MPIRKGHNPPRRFPPTPKLNRADVPGRDSAARERAPVCDSYDNEERSNHLSAGTFSWWCLSISICETNTNLGIGEEWEEDV